MGLAQEYIRSQILISDLVYLAFSMDELQPLESELSRSFLRVIRFNLENVLLTLIRFIHLIDVLGADHVIGVTEPEQDGDVSVAREDLCVVYVEDIKTQDIIDFVLHEVHAEENHNPGDVLFGGDIVDNLLEGREGRV